MPICSKYFIHKIIDEECEAHQFCSEEKLNPMAFNLFEHCPKELEFGDRYQSPRDVILMDKVIMINFIS